MCIVIKNTLCKNLKTFGQGKQKFEHGAKVCHYQFWSTTVFWSKIFFNKFQRIRIDITEDIELPEKLLARFFVWKE